MLNYELVPHYILKKKSLKINQIVIVRGGGRGMLKSNEDHRASFIVSPLKLEHVQCIIDNHTTEILSDLHCLIVYQYFK